MGGKIDDAFASLKPGSGEASSSGGYTSQLATFPSGTSPADPFGNAASVFLYGQRTRRDVGWTVAFVAVAIGVIIGAISVGSKGNTALYLAATPEALANAASCGAGGRGGRLLLDDDDDDYAAGGVRPGVFLGWGVGSLAVSAVLGFVYLQLFKRQSSKMMVFACVTHVLCIFVASVLMFSGGTIAGGVIFLLLACLLAYFYYATRDRLELCARLFGVSSTGLTEHPEIIGMAVGLWAVLGAFYITGAGFTFLAMTNGRVTVNPALSYYQGYASYKGNTCFIDGDQVPCCAWQMDGGAAFYTAYLWLFISWATYAVFQLRQFAIAGCIAQWYFRPVEVGRQPGTLARSLKHGLGPQFGTLAFGGMVLTIVDIIRSAIRAGQNNTSRNPLAAICCMITSCIAGLLLSLVEYLTKFATIWAAIKGDAFLAAGRAVTDLLTRNLLDSLRIWWFPQVVVLATSFALALLWTAIVFPLALAGVGAANANAAVGISVFAFFCAFVVLQLCGSILLNIVDTAYVCYAIDKDMRNVSHAELHDVFASLPVHKTPTGLLVEQPGGDYAYAPRPAAPGQQPPAAAAVYPTAGPYDAPYGAPAGYSAAPYPATGYVPGYPPAGYPAGYTAAAPYGQAAAPPAYPGLMAAHQAADPPPPAPGYRQ